MGVLQSRLVVTIMEVTTFDPLPGDENSCWHNVTANVLTHRESYYGVFADPARTLR